MGEERAAVTHSRERNANDETVLYWTPPPHKMDTMNLIRLEYLADLLITCNPKAEDCQLQNLMWQLRATAINSGDRTCADDLWIRYAHVVDNVMRELRFLIDNRHYDTGYRWDFVRFWACECANIYGFLKNHMMEYYASEMHLLEAGMPIVDETFSKDLYRQRIVDLNRNGHIGASLSKAHFECKRFEKRKAVYAQCKPESPLTHAFMQKRHNVRRYNPDAERNLKDPVMLRLRASSKIIKDHITKFANTCNSYTSFVPLSAKEVRKIRRKEKRIRNFERASLPMLPVSTICEKFAAAAYAEYISSRLPAGFDEVQELLEVIKTKLMQSNEGEITED